MTEAEEQEGKKDRHAAADAVIDGFYPADRKLPVFGDLLDQQLVGLRSDVGVKEKGDAHGAQHETGKKIQEAACQSPIREKADDSDPAVQYNAVEDGRCKGTEVGKPEAAQNQPDEKKEQCLQAVFRHAEGEEGQALGKLQMQQIGRCHHHGHAEVRPLHEGGTQRQNENSQKIGKLGVENRFAFQGETSKERMRKEGIYGARKTKLHTVISI